MKSQIKKPAKKKLCPDCDLELGAKVRTCPDCEHKFTFEKVILNGKNCPNCNTVLRKRAKECNKCQYLYPIKKKGYEEIVDWKQLKRGDSIHIRKGGLGPYYITETDGGYPSGTKFLMGYRGQFNVLEVMKDGIRCYGSKEGGLCFIYMGRKVKCESTGIIRRKHKLWRKAT